MYVSPQILKVVISPENQKSVQDYVSGILNSQQVPTPKSPIRFHDDLNQPENENLVNEKKSANKNGLNLPLASEATAAADDNGNKLVSNKRASLSPLIPPIYYTTPEDTLKNFEKLTEEQNVLMAKLESEEDDHKLLLQKVGVGEWLSEWNRQTYRD